MGDNASALAAYDRLLLESGESPAALMARAVLRWREGRNDEARTDVRRALEIDPDLAVRPYVGERFQLDQAAP